MDTNADILTREQVLDAGLVIDDDGEVYDPADARFIFEEDDDAEIVII